MSQLRLADGTGKGFLAKIDEDNRLATRGVAESDVKVATIEGRSFVLSATDIAIPANTPVNVLYVSFEDPRRNFIVDSLTHSWNGGNTNFNRPLTSIMSVMVGPPTANHVPSMMFNGNFTSTAVALATVYAWDGVGAGGMTLPAPGLPAYTMFYPHGVTRQEYAGGMIMGKGNTMAYKFSSPEAGRLSFVMSGYFEDAK